jgi:exodeoxyribonuclease-3
MGGAGTDDHLGDINVAPTDSDVFHPDAFVGSTHVTQPERAAFERLIDVGLIDVDTAKWGERQRRFTWWNHGISYARNLGMRIDVIAADPLSAALIDATWIDHLERGADRPSDHAALMADFRLSSGRSLASSVWAPTGRENPSSRDADAAQGTNVRKPT